MRLAQDLEQVLGQPLDRRNKADIWRYGTLYTYSEAWSRWAEMDRIITIKPDESLFAAERHLSGVIAIINA